MQHFGLGEPAAVVDHHVQVLESGSASLLPADPDSMNALAMAEDAVPGAASGDPAELLDVDVDEFARMPALVAIRWLWRLQA
jgi:hypothetical protein